MSMRFRETLWFKNKPVDEVEAAVPTTTEVAAPANELRPIEDRYVDDGQVSREDSQLFGLHTGRTEAMPKFGLPPAAAMMVVAAVPEAVLARELKGMRRVYGFTAIAVLGATVLALLLTAPF